MPLSLIQILQVTPGHHTRQDMYVFTSAEQAMWHIQLISMLTHMSIHGSRAREGTEESAMSVLYRGPCSSSTLDTRCRATCYTERRYVRTGLYRRGQPVHSAHSKPAPILWLPPGQKHSTPPPVRSNTRDKQPAECEAQPGRST